MGYITIGMLALTAIALLFGTLFGMRRGRNRSILRLILIIGCVAGAIFLRPVLTDIIMGIDTGDGTLAEMLASGFNQGEQAMPEAMQNLMFALVEIIFGLISYFIIFFVLRFITWILIFPILKIFVKKDLIKKRGWGALIGFIQGIVIAFSVLVPLNGLATTVDKLSKLEMEGKPMIEIPAEVGLDKHTDSITGGIYDTIGGWYYEILTTAKLPDGKEITLNKTSDMLVTLMSVMPAIQEFNDCIEILNDKENPKTTQEKIDALNTAGENIKEIGDYINGLDKDTIEFIDGMLPELMKMMGGGEGEGTTPEDNPFSDLKISEMKLDQVGKALTGIATYIDKAENNTGNITLEDAKAIVNGLANSPMIMDMFISEGMSIINIDECEELFREAISLTSLTEEQKSSLETSLGLDV